MPSSLVQRIRIRSNALSTDSKAANVPSYPSDAVEANPANTIEMANSLGHRIRRLVLWAIAGTSARSGEWRNAEEFRSTSAPVGAADHGSQTVAALGIGDRGRLRSARAPMRGCRRRQAYLPPVSRWTNSR